MALPPLATIEDLERRLGQPVKEPLERQRALALLSDASTLVRHEARQTWVDAEGALTAVPDIAVVVTMASAIRAWHNPADLDRADVGGASVRYRDTWLTAVERERLSSINRQYLTSTEMSSGWGYQWWPPGYVPVNYGDGVDNGDLIPLPWWDWPS